MFRLHHNIRALYFRCRYRNKFDKLSHMKRHEGEYTLLTFIDTKSIFVHIPKAAGISVCNAIFGGYGGGHTTGREYAAMFKKSEFDSFFKFTFVRNPWDRLYSAYTFLANGGMNEQDQSWSNENLAGINDFEDFVMKWLTEKSIYSYIHFFPQSDFLKLPETNDLLVDFVGYYENLEDDLKYVCRRLGRDVVLEHDNKTKRNGADYRTAYTPEMINRVALIYKEDIETFGYSFE